ncbi:MAG: septum formation protein Maf [Balneolaceae bacterium]|nr:MAG: septum formation protein Maf [Balneolaceae bacterium]
MRLVLASSSPRRASLLKQIGLSFITDPAAINEEISGWQKPSELALELAVMKGRAVAGRNPDSLVIAADTVVWLKNQLLGKPSDATQAADMLNRLSGNTHSVFTGVYVAKTDGTGVPESDFSFFERTKVTFSTLSDGEIDAYISVAKPYDKAGSYGIQDDLGSLFVSKIEGDYYNVVGFPLNSFYQNLRKWMPAVHHLLFPAGS